MGRELLTASRAAQFTLLTCRPPLPIFLSNSQYLSFICLSTCSNPGPCPASSLSAWTQLHILTFRLPPEHWLLLFPAGLGLTDFTSIQITFIFLSAYNRNLLKLNTACSSMLQACFNCDNNSIIESVTEY